ncbi:hypothetical protein RND81_14G201800 [Saponaria officinalis]|uniref:YqaJ viral recombinase domain-containing protein n=1 Tax=Saponaria officinalis TaxID=3572 RepID=A0AAW1GP61_SAPOF
MSRMIIKYYRTTKGSFGCSWENYFFIKSLNYNKVSWSYKRDIHDQSYPRCPSHCSRGDDYSVLKASSLQHWFKNWQELRNNKLTASTFGLAIGFWPRRRVQLWLEKIGAIEPFTGNLATCWNNIKEKDALKRYKLITRNTVFFPRFQLLDRSDSGNIDDWLAASPDGVVVDDNLCGSSSGGVLEVKCPFFDGEKSDALPWKRIPLYCIPQAQGLMEILNKDWMDFYVFTSNGSNLFRLYRDVEYWEILNSALRDFWWNHVQPARVICANSVITEPLTQLTHFKPQPRHELCSYIVYKSQRIVDNSRLVVREINGIYRIVDL